VFDGFSKKERNMRDFEWQYYEDYPDDSIDGDISYTEYMTDNGSYEEEYYDDQEVASWENYYNDIASEIIEDIDY